MTASRPLRLLLGTLVLVAAFLGLRRALGLGFDPDSMQLAVARMGIWAPLAYVGIVAFRVPLGLPSQLVLVGGGLAFGMLLGTLYGALGLLLSAVLLFLAARWTGRDALLPRLPPRLRPLFEVAETRAGALFLALGTGYPFGPITMYHLIAGVTGMALLVFVLAVGMGSLLRSALFTFFGSQLVAGDWAGLLAAAGDIGAVIAAPMLFPRSRTWMLQVLGRRAPDAADGAAVEVGAAPPDQSSSESLR